MTLFFNPFSRTQGGNAWFRVGLASSFPNITSEDEDNIAHARPCGSESVTSPGCKVFYVPKEDSSRANEVKLDDSGTPSEPGSLRDQVLVFQYKGKFHAINQASERNPNLAYPCLLPERLVTDRIHRSALIHHTLSQTECHSTSKISVSC